MKKRIFQVFVITLFLFIGYVHPRMAMAERPRSHTYYDNIINRQRRETGGTCSQGNYCTGDMYLVDAGYGTKQMQAKYGPHTITGAAAQEVCQQSSCTTPGGELPLPPGYYEGKKFSGYDLKTGNPNYDKIYIRVEPRTKGAADKEKAGQGGGGGVPAIPPGIAGVWVRAHELTTPTDQCSDVYASNTYISGTFSVTAPSYPLGSQTVTGGNYAQWVVTTGTKTITAVPPKNYILEVACWQKTNPVGSGTGLSAAVGVGQQVTWDLGYVNGMPWVQVAGGDVYSSGSVHSFIPATALIPWFVLPVDANGKSGIVTYGSDYDFDADIGGVGSAKVSPNKWLAQDSYQPTDYYQLMYRRFGSPTTADYDHPASPIAQPTSRVAPYYVTGDMTTSGNWLVPTGEKLLFIVNGNLTINGKINTAGTGFAAFIVNGNISIDPSVGLLISAGMNPSSIVPVVQGVYITNPSGVFSTGRSSVAGSELFYGKGIFVAGQFALQRSNRSVGGINYDTLIPSEEFQYDPQILVTMPDEMKDTNVTWQEVAP